MKKVHLVLTILAFFVAGAGVFATTTTQAVIEAVTDPEISPEPCNVLVPEDCRVGGAILCTFTGIANGKIYINQAIGNQTDNCSPLFRPQLP